MSENVGYERKQNPIDTEATCETRGCMLNVTSHVFNHNQLLIKLFRKRPDIFS